MVLKSKKAIAAAVTAGLVALGGGYYMTQEAYEQGKVFEGYSETAYPDPVYGWALPTICHGHTKGVYRGQVATPEQCEQWYQEDMAEGQAIVRAAIGGDLFDSLTQGEKDGYGMFAHNTGYFKHQRNGNLTGMYRRLMAGDNIGACGVLLAYKYGNGIPLAGLATRRTYEYERCYADLQVE